MFAEKVKILSNGIADMLIRKNESYGNSALDPIRVFAKSDDIEQICVRIDDKLSRIKRGKDFDNEDVINDLIGYLFLLKIKLEEKQHG